MTTHADLYPLPSVAFLREKFVGKSLKDVETPAAVIDLSITKRNCQNMLAVVEELGFGWRAHIKTHKVNRSPIISSPSPFSILRYLEY